jgi:hypothetical protein
MSAWIGFLVFSSANIVFNTSTNLSSQADEI